MNRSAFKTSMLNAQYSIIASLVGASIEEDPKKRAITDISIEEKSVMCTRFVDSWRMYIPVEEFGRMGVPNDKWRLCCFNSGYENVNTYPEVNCRSSILKYLKDLKFMFFLDTCRTGRCY